MNVLSHTYNKLLFNIYYNGLFIRLLLFILYVFLFMYLAYFSLCNGETEEELIARLEAEADVEDEGQVESFFDKFDKVYKLTDGYKESVCKYNNSVVKCTNFVDLTTKTMNLSEAKEEIPGVIKHMKATTLHAADEMKDLLAKVREAENKISEIDPNCKSSYKKQWFE